MSNVIQFTEDDDRWTVAGFASYCVGSCKGDWHPDAEAELERVMTNDAVYAVWRQRHRDYERQMSEGYGAICCGDPA